MTAHPPPPDGSRRRFLGLVLAGGAGAVGALAGRRLAGDPGLDDPSARASDKRELVLTADGRLAEATVVASAPRPPAASEVRAGIPGRKWVMVIDLAKCDGCAKCTEACSKMHFVPPDRQWIKVLRLRDARTTAPYFFPKPCYHCDNPPCTKVCPVDATFKRDDGIVLVDNERCIGCRFCMAACPYSARSFNWGPPHEPAEAREHPYSPEWGYPRRIGTVEKCDFCAHAARDGKLPACVAGCPMAALYYGDQNEDAVTNSKGETERFSRLLEDRAGYREMEDLGTEPRVYYLPPKLRMFPTPWDEVQEMPHHAQE